MQSRHWIQLLCELQCWHWHLRFGKCPGWQCRLLPKACQHLLIPLNLFCIVFSWDPSNISSQFQLMQKKQWVPWRRWSNTRRSPISMTLLQISSLSIKCWFQMMMAYHWHWTICDLIITWLWQSFGLCRNCLLCSQTVLGMAIHLNILGAAAWSLNSVWICQRNVDNIVTLCSLTRASGCPPDFTLYSYNRGLPDSIQYT